MISLPSAAAGFRVAGGMVGYGCQIKRRATYKLYCINARAAIDTGQLAVASIVRRVQLVNVAIINDKGVVACAAVGHIRPAVTDDDIVA